MNIHFIAERLGLRGIKLAEVRIVRDEEAAIVDAARALSAAYDYVFSTGGIGPTHDDITAECMARAFDTKLEINEDARRRLAEYYAARGVEMTEGRLRMARIPAGATLIRVCRSSRCAGLQNKECLRYGGRCRRSCRAMFLGIEPTLAQGLPMLSNTVTGSLRESEIALEMEEIQKQNPDVEIGSYPTMSPSPSVSLVLRSVDEKKLKAVTEKIVAMVKKFDADAVITYQRPPKA